MAKCLISAGVLRNSQVLLGCQPEDEGRLCAPTPDTDLGTQLSLAGCASGREFHESSQEPLGVGHRCTDHREVEV